MGNVAILAIVFGAGVPLLYPSAAFVMFVRFWWDKTWLLKVSAAPKLFQARITDAMAKWFYFAVCLNLIFSCWMFSSEEFLVSDTDRTLQKVIGIPPKHGGYVDSSPFIAGRTLREIGNRLAKVHVEPILALTLLVLAAAFCYLIWNVTMALVFLVTCGARGGGSALSMEDIRILQKRSVVELALGSQCFLWGGKSKYARVTSELSITRVMKSPGGSVMDGDGGEELTIDLEASPSKTPGDKEKTDRQLAIALNNAVRFEDIAKAVENTLDEFPGTLLVALYP